MSLSQFKDIISLSNEEIFDEVNKVETIIFNLKFKKSTRQNFKLSDLKKGKRRLAQLKTVLQMRVKDKQLSEELIIEQLN